MGRFWRALLPYIHGRGNKNISLETKEEGAVIKIRKRRLPFLNPAPTTEFKEV
jgi:hypothetical protein